MVSALDLPLEASPQERYVFKPSYGSSHHWALGQLASHVEGKRVLDIGAGGGGIGRAARSANPQQLVAIEIDPRAQAALRSTYDEVYADITSLTGRQFELVVLLDVLEHMSDPFGFLKQLRPLLAPGARLIISVPNVAHWSVRFGLLFGRFEYRSRGILDRTHLQFFSRRRFLEMCNSVERSDVAVTSGSIEPIELILPEWASNNSVFEWLARARFHLAELLPGLMAYQHLGVIVVR
jgi:SAM-dependent methyltransferase